MAEPVVATKQMVEEIFDGAAARYDREGPGIFHTFGTRLIELMAIEPGARVLDVATGTGAVLIPAAQQVTRLGHVVGIDLSDGMLREAENNAHEAGINNFELYKMDAEDLQIRDGIFDAVTCAFSIFFFHAMDSALHEMYRVLRPGGRIGLTLFGGAPPPFDPGWRIFAEQARAYGTAVRTPQRVVYSLDEARFLLTSSKFVEVKTQLEKYEVIYANEEAWWAFQLTLGNRAAIMRLPENVRLQFKEEYSARMRPLFQADGLHVGVSVIYAVATRP